MSPGLLDQFGVPFPPEALKRLADEEAGPTLAGVRQVVSGSPADGMTPRRLSAIHRAAAEGDTLMAMELAEDIEERDLHYLAVLSTRKRQVSQLPLTIEAASEDPEHETHADFIRAWLKTGLLEQSLFDMLDAIGKGFSVTEIGWSVGDDGILPRTMTYRSPRWFEVDRWDGETILLRDLAATPLDREDINRPGSNFPQQPGLLPLAPHKFITHRYKAKSGILSRAGLSRVASWAWMYKAFTLRDWAVFVQNYGMPIRIGKYGPEADERDRRVLWNAVANIAGDCAAIIPKSMEIEFVKPEGNAAASEVYQRRADWMDQQVSKLVLGQTTTTDAISGGHAVSREHRLVQEDIERADARALSVTLTAQLVQLMIALNFPAYVAGGGRAYPRLLLGRPDELPIGEITEGVRWLGPQGLKVTAKQLRERLGFDEPAEGDETVGGTPPPPVAVVSPPHVGSKAEAARGPEIAPAAHSMLASLRPRTAQPASTDPELLDRLQQRMELDAAGALIGLTEQVRAAIEAAEDLPDLQARLGTLQLDPSAFAAAMQRGLAISHLVGQAALLDEIRGA